MIRWGIFVWLLIASLSALAQKEDDIKDYIPSQNVDLDSKVRKKKYKPRTYYSKIYKSEIGGTLYGNKCALEATHKMGFEYVIEVPGAPGSKTHVGKFINNFWVNTKLCLTRSPFWKLILNGKFRKCRQLSGDGVG